MSNVVTTLEPADLEMRVTVREDRAGWTLGYVLNSLKLDLFNVRSTHVGHDELISGLSQR